MPNPSASLVSTFPLTQKALRDPGDRPRLKQEDKTILMMCITLYGKSIEVSGHVIDQLLVQEVVIVVVAVGQPARLLHAFLELLLGDAGKRKVELRSSGVSAGLVTGGVLLGRGRDVFGGVVEDYLGQLALLELSRLDDLG